MAVIYVGIDWADDHHDVHITDTAAKPLDTFVISHNQQGLEELGQRLRRWTGKPEDVLIAVEWHKGLLMFNLVQAGYQVYPINPRSTDRYRDRYRMSSSKSDRGDAMVLANILRTDLHLYRPLSMEALAHTQLQQLTRAYEALQKQKVRTQNHLTAVLKNYYPVALDLFSGLDRDIALAFLEQYPSPEEAAAASLEELQHFFREHRYTCPRKVPQIHAALQEPALRSYTLTALADRTIVLGFAAVLRVLVKQMAAVEKELLTVFQQSPNYDILSSLPAGPMVAATLAAEIGSDKSRFPSAGCLRSYAGTAPVTRRSGKTIMVHFRKGCNKRLRKAFQRLAMDSVRKHRWAQEYFDSQMARGHKKSRAYRALANRWVDIVWKMLQEGARFCEARLLARRSSNMEVKPVANSTAAMEEWIGEPPKRLQQSSDFAPETPYARGGCSPGRVKTADPVD